MILRVWFKIFLIIFLVSVPLIWVQYLSQRESLQLALEVNERIFPVALMESYLQNLRQLSKLDTKNEARYRNEFETTLERKFALTDMRVLKDRVIQNLLKDTLRNMVLVLMVFLILSFLVSRNLVATFRKLSEKIEKQSLHLEQLRSIESWQKIARVLVHELRAPITPIKLIATDIEKKYEILSVEKFSFYLREGAQLIRAQVQSVEKLLESFTLFAKLPEVKLTRCSILETLNHFMVLYQGYGSGQIFLNLEVGEMRDPKLWIDAEALNHLFFNLIKNALESNKNRELKISFAISQMREKTSILISNNGEKIPDDMANRIFDLHISTKKGMNHPNLGMGLTISRKIALDHKGSLALKTNEDGKVTFELELPHL